MKTLLLAVLLLVGIASARMLRLGNKSLPEHYQVVETRTVADKSVGQTSS